MLKIITTLLLSIISINASCCSAFQLQRKEFLLHAVNLDWKYREGTAVIHPRNTLNTAVIDNRNWHPLIWKSTYGSIVIHGGNTENIGPAADGMNEKGLVASALILNSSQYDVSVTETPALNSGLWVQYVLDKHQSVQEVLNDSNSYRVVGESYRNIALKLHLYISDSSGDSAILEYLNGKLTVSRADTPYTHILTNSEYHWSLDKLVDFSPFGGSLTLPGMAVSLSRFVRGAAWMKNLPAFIAKEDAIAYSFAGLGRLAQLSGDRTPTQSSMVFDPQHKTMYWRTVNEASIRFVKLDEVDFEHLYLSISHPIYAHVQGNVLPFFTSD